jgi:hypothetical protein
MVVLPHQKRAAIKVRKQNHFQHPTIRELYIYTEPAELLEQQVN